MALGSRRNAAQHKAAGNGAGCPGRMSASACRPAARRQLFTSFRYNFGVATGARALPQFTTGLLKLLFASMITGALMNLFGLSAENLLAKIGQTPEQLWIMVVAFISWAIPNILLGAVIILPIWFFTYLFLPPRKGADN
jgi:hypothetical protein